MKAYFFIIWNPSSHLPPTVRFEKRKEAIRVAEAMASQYGQSFYVMRAVTLSNRGAAVTTVLK